MRRYNCTYRAPNFLFPPLELSHLASIVTSWKKTECLLIDAVAEALSPDKVMRRLKTYQPRLLVFMAGIETLAEDMRIISLIKANLSQLKTASIGYLPSLSPEKTLTENPALDYIIRDEPEISFSELYDCLENNSSPAGLPGIAYRDNGTITIGRKRERIKDLDLLPFPASGLLHQGLYNEFLLRRPFTTIQTSRGCPYECVFCVPAYGREIVYRSADNVYREIEEAVSKYKIKTIRFMDDTLTLNKNRLLELCGLLLKKNLKFDWSCLSRVDSLDKEMLVIMKKAGCRRKYLGIETFSQRLLDYYRKGYDAALIRPRVEMIKRSKIEVVGFFIVSGEQTEDEFKNDVSLARQTGLDYIVVEKLTPYPGTAVFDNKKDSCGETEAIRREKEFYRAFYLRPGYAFSKIWRLLSNINDAYLGRGSLKNYLNKTQDNSPRPELI
ncbi:MAG: radical SAM protein [Candidatus Omnitrophota bacterium]